MVVEITIEVRNVDVNLEIIVIEKIEGIIIKIEDIMNFITRTIVINTLIDLMVVLL